VSSATPALKPPPPQPGRRRRVVLDLVQFAAFAGLILWLVVRGAQDMGYVWQWQRVPRHIYQVFEGEIIWGPLVKGLIVTLEISALAMVLTIVIGLFAAVLNESRSIVGSALVRVYVEIIRNTPLLIQLFLFYFVLAPILGIDRFWTGVIALAVFEGAFAAEIFRSGIAAVPKGQWEAARSIGLKPWGIYRFVVLPQALRIVLPPTTGLMVSLVKHSAIVSVIAVFDLTNEGRNVIADTFMTFEIWLTVAAMYLSVTLVLSGLASLLEHRLARGSYRS
jgi:polar amino acid transport system permease protein